MKKTILKQKDDTGQNCFSNNFMPNLHRQFEKKLQHSK